MASEHRVLHVVFNCGPGNMGYNDFYAAGAELGYRSNFCSLREASSHRWLRWIAFISDFIKKSQECDLVHYHSPILFVLLLPYSLFYTGILTVHTSFQNYGVRNRIFFFISFFFCRRVVFCSQCSRESFPEYFGTHQKSCVIRNGVLIPNVAVSKPQVKFKEYCVVGRLVSLKRPDWVLRAFRQSNVNGSLIYVGSGPLRDQLEMCAAGLNVNFLGLVERRKVGEALARSRFFVSSSSVEGFPVSVLEAVAHRCGLILSDIPAHRELTTQGVKAYLFSNVAELVSILVKVETMQDHEFDEIVSGNYDLLLERFTLTEMLKEYNKLYYECLLHH